MSHRVAAAPSSDVVVLDTPPRPANPRPHHVADDVIVLDSFPQPQRPAPRPTPHETVLLDDTPRKRRRRYDSTALPPHPRASATTPDAAPVIVVEDDDSSDPDTSTPPHPAPPFTRVAPPPDLQPHVRLPHRLGSAPVPLDDDIVEMNASGPRVAAAASSSAPPVSHPHPAIAVPSAPAPTLRRTSMPPLFTASANAARGVDAHNTPSHFEDRSLLPSLQPSHPTQRVPASLLPQAVGPAAHQRARTGFPHPLPELALPSAGRTSAATTNRAISFSESLANEQLSPRARGSLRIIRDLEEHGVTASPSNPGATGVAPTSAATLETPSAPVNTTTPQMSYGIRRVSFATARLANARQLEVRRANALRTAAVQARASRSQTEPQSQSQSHRTARSVFVADSDAAATGQHFGATNPAPNDSSFLPGDAVLDSLVAEASNLVSQLPRRATQMDHAMSARRLAAILRRTEQRAARRATTISSVTSTVASAGRQTQAGPSSRGRGLTVTTSVRINHPSGDQQARRRGTHVHRRLLRIGGMPHALEMQYMTLGDRALDYEQLIRLDEQLIREKNRADKEQIESLPTKKATSSDQEIRCCICMCDVEQGEELRVLPCGHKYHKACIDEWLTYNGCCPVDKKRIGQERPRRACPRN